MVRLRVGIFGQTWAYHAVNITLETIWLITPLSIMVLGYSLRIILYRQLSTSLPIITVILCTMELASAIYQRYLIRITSRFTPSSALALKDWEVVGRSMFHLDLITVTNGGRTSDIDVMQNRVDGDAVGERMLLWKGEESMGEAMSSLVMCCSGDTWHDKIIETRERARAFRQRYAIWFHNAPWEDLRRDDVLTWISATALNLTLEQVLEDPASSAIVNKIYACFASRSAWTFPPGRNPLVRLSLLSLDPFNAVPRPLIIYAVTHIVNSGIRHIYLPRMGMYNYKQGDIEYMLRIPPGWTPAAGRSDPHATPLMYLHGMGFGLMQNIKTVKPLLDRYPTHPLLFPIAHHTTYSIFSPAYLKPWTRKSFVRDMDAICERWGFQLVSKGGSEVCEKGGLSVMSHSNGSVHHVWLLKDRPLLIRRNTFVDPVIFCLDEGFTYHAFCHKVPITPYDLLMRRLISTELGISNYIQRHFHWRDISLCVIDHPDLLDPAKTQYFLGKKDAVVDAPRVREYLESHGVADGVNLTWDEEGAHSRALEGDSLPRVQRFMGTGVRDWA